MSHCGPKYLNVNCEVFGSSPTHLAQGFENGIVKLYDAAKNYEIIKTFDNLKTKISFVDVNEKYMVFGSKWKNNSIRIYDIDKQTLGNFKSDLIYRFV